MRFRPLPQFDYHHVQARPIVPVPHHRGDLMMWTRRHLKDLPIVPKPERPAPRSRPPFAIEIWPTPAPDPAPFSSYYPMAGVEPPACHVNEVARLMPALLVVALFTGFRNWCAGLFRK